MGFLPSPIISRTYLYDSRHQSTSLHVHVKFRVEYCLRHNRTQECHRRESVFVLELFTGWKKDSPSCSSCCSSSCSTDFRSATVSPPQPWMDVTINNKRELRDVSVIASFSSALPAGSPLRTTCTHSVNAPRRDARPRQIRLFFTTQIPVTQTPSAPSIRAWVSWRHNDCAKGLHTFLLYRCLTTVCCRRMYKRPVVVMHKSATRWSHILTAD